MVYDKKDFIREFLPETIQDVSYAQIDLDISDMSISDILRNINRTYPKNSKCRNQISSGQLAVAVMCKSEYMYPLRGLLIIVANTSRPIELVSKDYIIMTVSDDDISKEDNIVHIISAFTKYLIDNFANVFDQFQEFYVKYVYDPEEDSEWEEDYIAED